MGPSRFCRTVLSAILLFGLLVLALQAAPAGAEAPAPLKLGVISGLTGIAAKWNHFQNQGMQLAQEELAASGQKIELIFEDSQTTGNKVISAFNKLVTFDAVDAVIADDFGYVVAPLIQLADQRRKLLVTLSLPQDSYCRSSKGYFFTITSQFIFTRPAFDQFFRLHPEVKKAAMFVFDDPEWGETYKSIWTDLAAQHGVQIVGTFQTNDPTPDFKTALAKVLTEKPDLLLLAHEPVTFSKAVRALGYSGPILSANNFLEVLAAREDLGPLADRVYIADPGVSAEFSSRYEARFGEAPILEAYAGYEAVRAVARAFAANRERPEIGMRTVKYEGVAGMIDFSGPSCAGNFARWGLYTLGGGRLNPVNSSGN